jgi:hypothetical protein
MKLTPRVNYGTVRDLALALADVEEGSSYGTPAMRVKGKLFVRLREDPDSLAIRMPFEQRTKLMRSNPKTYYITDHYRDYEWMLVRLSKVEAEAMKELLEIAHRTALGPQGRARKSRGGG